MAAITASSAVSFVALGSAGLGASAIAATLAAAGRFGKSPGTRALIHWIPIACTVLLARFIGGWDVVLGIIFGSSVAVMAGVMGSVAFTAPIGPAPVNWKRLWPFTLAAALLVYVSGFNGLLTWKHGMALFVEGLALFSLWQDPGVTEWSDSTAKQDPIAPPGLVWGALGACVILAASGAYAATRAAAVMPLFSAGAIGASLLSFVLTMPMIQGDRRLAAAGASWLAATSEIGVVLLNLCVLLPIVAITPYVVAFFRAVHLAGRPIFDVSTFQPHVTPFPLAHWRIDTVMLILLSVLMLPVAMGKWNLGREEGVVLIVGYAIYLAATILAGMSPV